MAWVSSSLTHVAKLGSSGSGGLLCHVGRLTARGMENLWVVYAPAWSDGPAAAVAVELGTAAADAVSSWFASAPQDASTGMATVIAGRCKGVANDRASRHLDSWVLLGHRRTQGRTRTTLRRGD